VSKTVKTICSWCGIEFESPISSINKGYGKFCSKKCADYSRVKKEIKICPICGKEFTTTPSEIKRNRGIFCSHKCRGIAKSTQPNKECPICGKMFVARPHREADGRDKFCSKACGYKANGNPPANATCLYCGKDFMVEYNRAVNGRGKFCSRACKGKWMSENLINDKALRWNPELTDKQRIINSVRKISGYSEWRAEVYQRDNYTCQHCGDNRGGNLNAHHIIPFSSDNTLRTELSNGITLCVKCHKREHKRLRNMLKDQADFFVV